MNLKIREIRASSILIKSGLPAADWVINPYNGCLFGCMYCYAAQIARWKHPDEIWGNYLDVKINASELLKNELEKLVIRRSHHIYDFGSIFFSSVTDPYVGMEAKYKLTRKCLEVLADFGYQGSISILTKSPLITRDIDLFKKFKDIEVGMTVTGLDDKVSRFLEVKAPPVTSRIKALKELSDAGINTYAFVGPIVPYFIHDEKKIKEIIDKLEEIGVKKVWFEHLNLSPKIKARLYEYLKKESPELITEFEKTDTEKYREKLNKIIEKQMNGRKIKMGYKEVIYHKKLTKKIG
ncbi:MAG: Radical SAM domain protein [Candidatus Roizmanbacteria bacterium GW2011_GWA2_35_19]|uniref:Radical SAM domain protein n=2 Tax=Candidatus Roizmaniibacteriota TaxID=1752723 RepID=A0A0G0CEG3_9BACT|nr:MAG: Radical SAM domain protein [Candidatus Roizmanbacteria bacterium GW2011_GWC2_35_12]KKP74471.1 MAG: Radical SAM domain protein [Candidatus Roizmanbacteria bacterium GW2011_GWA2_35_19]